MKRIPMRKSKAQRKQRKVATPKTKEKGRVPQVKVSPLSGNVLTLIIGVVLVVATFVVFWQVGHHQWENSKKLFRHGLKVTVNNYHMHNNLGVVLAREGKMEEAMAHYTGVLRIHPGLVHARNNIGGILFQEGKIQEAIAHHHEALRINPNLPEAHYSLGLAYLMMGNRESALEEYKILNTINPNLANALSRKIFE